jgi:hypothetical protein
MEDWLASWNGESAFGHSALGPFDRLRTSRASRGSQDEQAGIRIAAQTCSTVIGNDVAFFHIILLQFLEVVKGLP